MCGFTSINQKALKIYMKYLKSYEFFQSPISTFWVVVNKVWLTNGTSWHLFGHILAFVPWFAIQNVYTQEYDLLWKLEVILEHFM
jgi:hypothetical protein